MNKVSKLLVMGIVILAVVTISLRVNANTADLINYIKSSHTINGVKFELKEEQKNQITKYLEKNASNTQSTEALNQIKEAEKIVANSGVKKIGDLNGTDKTKVINLAQSAAKKVNLNLEVNSKNNTFALKTSDGKVLASDSAKALVKSGSSNSGSGNGSGNSGSTSTTDKLLYTGYSYAVYASVTLVIVAIAVLIAKKKHN